MPEQSKKLGLVGGVLTGYRHDSNIFFQLGQSKQ